jgi:lysophospholipase L1-like esterase
MALFALPAPAQAWLAVGADSSREPGQINLFVWGSGTFTSVDLIERSGGVAEPLRTVVLPIVLADDGGIWSGTVYKRVVQWRCDRVVRTFEAIGHRPDGTTETSTSEIRTPSCRNRLRLSAPPSVQPGRRAVIRVRDYFELGGVTGRLCLRPPGASQRCQDLRIAAGRTVATYAFHPQARGRWGVSVEAPDQHLTQTLSVGVEPAPGARLPVLLTTGDSLMINLDAVLQDRLTGRARVKRDIKIGSGLSKTFPVHWSSLPAQQVARLHPQATVMFVGTNDSWPMEVPGGSEVECCGEPWVAEYARRVRAAMRTYLRAGPVVWLNVPPPRDPRRQAAVDAVNAALARAVQGLERAAVVDVASVFAPYTDFLDGVRVRERDGVHLSPAGAAIAARLVMRRLERLGVV